MTNNTPSDAKKHREITELESYRTTKIFSFFFFHWAVHQAIRFFQVWSPTRRFKLLTEELWLPLQCHVLFTCTHAQKSLSNKMPLLLKIAELEIQLVCREGACSGHWFFSQYCMGSLWRQTCCSVIDGKLQLKHVSFANKVTWTRIKNIKNVTRCSSVYNHTLHIFPH